MIWGNFYLHFFDSLYFLKILVSESENLWTQLTFVNNRDRKYNIENNGTY